MPDVEIERTPSAAGDWWIRGVAPLAMLHLALFLTLRARPGAPAVVLWKWGPPLLLAANALLLGAALVSALRRRQTVSARRAVGLVGVTLLVATTATYRTYPSSHDHAPSEVEFRLPLDGPVTVAWGGATAGVNYHVRAPAERWAYDLLIAVDGVTYRGDGARPEDYYAYDRLIVAPAAGRVVAVHDGDPDEPPGQPDAQRGGGNRIVVEVAPDQYLTVAHGCVQGLEIRRRRAELRGAVPSRPCIP